MSQNKKQRRKAMLERLRELEHEEPSRRLKDESIRKLRQLGLFISTNPNFGPNHVSMPNGYFVFKPNNTVGNSLIGYNVHFSDDSGNEIVTDAPSPIIYSSGTSGWSVLVHEYIPGPGPGDFDQLFTSEDDAVEDVICYLLGKHEKFEERLIAHEKSK